MYTVRAHDGAMLGSGKSLTPQAIRPDEIGRRMRALRMSLGMTQADISDDLQIPQAYWSRFETGNRPLTMEVAARIAERYGVTMDYLLLGRMNGLAADMVQRLNRHL